MPLLKLKLVSKAEIGQSSSASFSQQGGTIGRSNDCDWTLLDMDRFISNKHAQINYQNEQFILTDTSSNGVYINNSGSPIGKQNSHILTKSDRIKIGIYEIAVEIIDVVDMSQQTPNVIPDDGDSDLLGLVMGGDVKSTDNNETDYLNISSSDKMDQNPQLDDDLGLSDILSSPANSYNQSQTDNSVPPFSSASPINDSAKLPIEPPSFQKSAFVESTPEQMKNKHYLSNDSSIPEDWELSGILPAIPDYEPQKPQTQKPAEILTEEIEENIPKEPAISNEPSVPVYEVPPIEQLVPNAPIDVNIPVEPVIPVEPNIPGEEVHPIEPVKPPEAISSNVAEAPIESKETIAPSTRKVDTTTGDVKSDKSIKNEPDKFLEILYKKLDLPKEYLESIDEEAFAEDIATVLLSTTKGLMSLLNSRTLFKQESRLSLTSVQPRSNNPIKFSIDPVDTLEMLLLKKKRGYLSAKDSYDEAINDIQLHQMAFLSGLQATLVGILGQVSPELIENQINEKGKSIIGMKAKSQYWELYKEKQKSLAKGVTENLNEVLSTFFSEAYQAQINSFKNDKK